MVEGIKKLILAEVPNKACNLKCEYCYISQLSDWKGHEKLKYSPEYIAKALSKERLGGISLINLTGNGETMLQEDIVELIRNLLLEGHFVEVVTNGTIKNRMMEVTRFPQELRERLFFKISFHYKELLRLNLLDEFYETIKLLQEKNIAFTLELMAYDGIEGQIEEIIESNKKNVGAVCHSTIGRMDYKRSRELLSKHSVESYKSIWGRLDSNLLDFKLEILGKKRKEFCYAGSWSLFVDLYTGNAKACYGQPFNQNIYENIDKPLKFIPVGRYCTEPYCINGHSHLTWGCIPELSTPSYLTMRNRECMDGANWIDNNCKDFFKTKLCDSNDQYKTIRKIMHTVYYSFLMLMWIIIRLKTNMVRLPKLWFIWNDKKNK